MSFSHRNYRSSTPAQRVKFAQENNANVADEVINCPYCGKRAVLKYSYGDERGTVYKHSKFTRSTNAKGRTGGITTTTYCRPEGTK